MWKKPRTHGIVAKVYFHLKCKKCKLYSKLQTCKHRIISIITLSSNISEITCICIKEVGKFLSWNHFFSFFKVGMISSSSSLPGCSTLMIGTDCCLRRLPTRFSAFLAGMYKWGPQNPLFMTKLWKILRILLNKSSNLVNSACSFS